MVTTRHGFTLVEILVVTIVLGLLAAIVLPEFSNASQMARAAMLRDNLRLMRSQTMVFKAQHNNVSPGYPDGDVEQNPTAEALVAQITKPSNAEGETAELGTVGYDYGPYMRQVPENPINGKTSVRVLGDGAEFPTEPQDSDGWIYQPSTLLFKSDCTGEDENGTPYFEY